MKKIFSTVVVLLIALTSFSQPKKPIQKLEIDSLQKDTVYAVVLEKNELEWLKNIIKGQDEKPSTIKQQLEAITQKTRIFLQPKKK